MLCELTPKPHRVLSAQKSCRQMLMLGEASKQWQDPKHFTCSRDMDQYGYIN